MKFVRPKLYSSILESVYKDSFRGSAQQSHAALPFTLVCTFILGFHGSQRARACICLEDLPFDVGGLEVGLHNSCVVLLVMVFNV